MQGAKDKHLFEASVERNNKRGLETIARAPSLDIWFLYKYPMDNAQIHIHNENVAASYLVAETVSRFPYFNVNYHRL